MITHVAIKHDGQVWSLPKPCRHHHVLELMFNKGVGSAGPDIQGFLNGDGQFLNRHDAMKAAVSSGQLNRRPGANNYQGEMLFSEDLW
jgi:hypothetical protein